MPSSAIRTLLWVLSACATVGTVGGVTFWSSPACAQEEQAGESEPRIGFAFKNAPFDQVLDFFSRQSGVPIIFEADAPAGTLTFVSANEYTLDAGISVLNMTLRRHDRYLRHEGDFLYLSTLPEAAKRAGESFSAELPEGVTPDQIVTVTIPLSNANAGLVAEQIKPLLDAYGSVTPVPEQNIVIVVETAAQVERISQVIQTIDERKPVDSSYRLFPLKNAQADAVVNALKGLVGTRVQRIIIDKDGKQNVVEEMDVGGLSIQPDRRTNAVIVVGPESRIETVEELIALLDADEAGAVGGRRLVTLPLRTVTPRIASDRITQLFAGIDKAKRPTVVPLDESGKIAVVGSEDQLVQVTALIDELDPRRGDAGQSDDEIARVVALEHLSAQSASTIVSRLLTPRQQALIRIVPGNDGRSLIVAGPGEEIARFEKLLAGIDRPASGSREVRVVRIDAADPASVFESADNLYTASHEEPERLERSLDEASAALTLIGARSDIDEYVRLLGEAQKAVSLATQTRTYDVTNESPEQLASRLGRIVSLVLGNQGPRPTIQAIPELDQVIVRAQPAQFQLIDSLVAQITEKSSSQVQVEVIRLHSADAEGLIERAQSMAQLANPDLPAAAVQHDETSGNLIVTGSAESVAAFSEGLKQAQSLSAPVRTTRVIDVQRANAADLVAPLREFLASADPIDPGRRVPEPTISVVERTNSLLVVAEPAQHQIIVDHVRRLDVLEQTDLPPLRLLQLRTAEAQSIASMLTEQYRQRPQTERTAKPVEVRADAATNTLIIAAHEDLFLDIKAFVEDLNTTQSDGPERVTKLFPLRVARAADVALAMDRLYPEPPIPLDRRGVPMPWLREPKQVTVSAEENSNSLIIDAPADRMDSLTELAEQLDRVQVPAAAELRTYRVENADLQVIAQALTGLANRGILSSPAQAGRQAVQVLIETEPRSKTLIVAGDEVTFQKVEQMLADLSAVPVERELRVVPIVGQLATDIARRAQQIYETQTKTLPDAKPVEIQIDEESNTLEIVAETESMERFLTVLDELQSQTGPARQIRLVELRTAAAADVAAFLEELLSSSAAIKQHGGPMPTFEAIDSTNSLLISATHEDWAVIDPLITSLDTAEGQERPPLRIMRLRSTDAVGIATVLQQSFDRRPAAERTRLPVDIRSDAATNTLIVSAHQEVMPEIESLVADLNDAQAIDGEGRGIQIFPLRVARAEELARTIDQMYPEPPMPVDSRGRPRPDLRQPKEIVVRADMATNSLIVDAPSARLAGFEQLVRELDRAKVTEDVEVRTYAIERAELASVQATLRELADRSALGTTGRTPVTITTEARGRTLIVSGPVDIFPQVEKLIDELDAKPDVPDRVMRLYRLEYARADLLAPMLREALADQLREVVGANTDDQNDVLNISADARSNTLIIYAPEVVQQIAAELVQALDSEASASARHVVRVISLTFADANSVAPTITAAAGAMEIPATDRPLISAVRGVNSIVLSGAASDVERLVELVESLDIRPVDSDSPGVETFTLEHASAGAIAQTVERLLANQLETDPRVMAVRMRYVRDAAPPAPTVRVEADDRTNSLIVSAPMETIELARAIVERLDQPTGEQPTMMTFSPTRAAPARLASVVQGVMDETRTPNVPVAELHVEPASATIVVTGQPDEVARAVGLLAEFDERAVALPETSMRMVELTNASADSVARTLTSVLGDRTRWPEELVRAEEAGLAVAKPSFTAEPGTNRILMVAPAPLEALATELIASLDRTDASAAKDTRVYNLRQGDAQSVATAVSASLSAAGKPGQTPANVSAEPVSNSVVVVGDAEQITLAESLIKNMDEAVDTDGVSVRTIVLNNARAESLAPIIDEIVRREDATQMLPSWMMASYLAQGGSVRQPARVVAEPRLNALVVTGPGPVLDLAEQVIAELDSPQQAAGAQRPVRVLTVRNADAAGIAQTIEAVFAEEASASTPPVVRVDAAANALVIRADLVQLERIDQLVSELDEAAVLSSRQLRRISVDPSRMNAGELAEILRGMIQEKSGASVEVIDATKLGKPATGEVPERGAWLAPGSGHPLQIMGEAVASLVLAQDLAASVPQPALGTASETPASQPDDEPETSQESQEQGEPEQETLQPKPEAQPATAPTPEEPEVLITVDPATNSLIVTGSTLMTQRIAELADEIQRMAPVQPTRARIVRLPDGVDPNAVYTVLARTVQQIGVRNDRNPGGFTGRVAAAPDVAGNSVIVWANDTDFASVGPLIAAMSQPASIESRVVKVYPLSSVRSTRALAAVRDFISPAPSGRQAQRIRSASVEVEGADGETILAELDASQISVSSGPGDRSLIVSAPGSALPAIDRFIALIDQTPSEAHMGIRRYVLETADAPSLARSLTQLFNAQRQMNQDLPRPAIVADARNNTLLVTANTAQHEEIDRLLPTLDTEVASEDEVLEIFRLTQNRPTSVRRTLNDLMLTDDPAMRAAVRISADDTVGVLMVRAPEEQLAEIRKVISDLDTASAQDLPVHTLTVERADAAQVADAVTRFFADRDRASNRTGGRVAPSVAITADSRSGSIVVAASDEDFEQIKSLVETFDGSPEAKDLLYRVFRLEHARASDLGGIVQSISWELQYERMYGRNQQAGNQDRLYVEANDRLNAIVVLGSPDRMETIERVIAELDVPTGEMGEMALKAIVLQKADANAVARVIRESTATPGWRVWQGRDPEAVVAEVDRSRNAVLLIGKRERVELAAGFVEEIERAGGEGGDQVSTIRLEHASADRAANSINRFFNSRARAQGIATTGVTVVGSADGNVIVVAANETDTELVKQLVADIDQPQMGEDREIQVYTLKNANVSETSRTVTAMFPSARGRNEDRVIVTPQTQTRSLIISAPTKLQEPIAQLIDELDRPPTDEDARIVTVTLETALATDVARSLREALPENVQVKVTAVERSNSLLLTGSDEAIKLVMQRIEELDAEPSRNFMEFRRVSIKHADAYEVASTLRTITRARPAGPGGARPGVDYNSDDNTVAISAFADELDELLNIIEQLDAPRDTERKTEFVPLEFANATQIAEALDTFFGPFAIAATTPGARRVTIVPDAASNSLVISADKSEWESIMQLLATLDNEEYDTSRQLAVIKLEYADASSVAGALDEGFRATVDAQLRRDQARQQSRQQNGRDNQASAPPVLIRAEDLPTVSAEAETNSLVVFASRKDLERIRSIVEQIDRAEFAEYPQARIIPVSQGRPSQIAVAVRELYGRQTQGAQGKRSVLVFGDDTSGTLIVRSDDRTFVQIEALANAVQEQSDRRGVKVRVLTLENAPASRIRTALLEAFQRTAESRGESLSIQADRTRNALVIASTEELYEEIAQTARELDGTLDAQPEGQQNDLPGVFGGLQIVDVQNNDPASIIQLLTELGVTRPVSPDQASIVADPVQLSRLSSRRAIAVTGNPADVDAVVKLIPSLDREAIEPTHAAAIIPLDIADASAVVNTLRDMLTPASGATGASPAKAAAEHLRRLSVANGAEEPLQFDLAAPLRIMADTTTNSVIVASTDANVKGVRELASMMDRLPVGEAVVIRVFPLNSASADRVRTIIDELFRQGAQLGNVPGTNRRTQPSTTTGQALLNELAMSVDERSNSLIVAGKEESVALVEVLIGDLDGEQSASWVEPTLVMLEHADPREMADRLNSVLVRGLTDTPESEALRRQAGRIRLATLGAEGEQVKNADLFTAAGTLIIEPEPNLRALLVLGSPANVEVVRGLASMMDVEAAAASNRVRLFPLEHAAADRILNIVTNLFNERTRQPSFREEDRLIAAVDARTNTLIVSTSPESFEVLDALLASLDSADPNYAVGLHVVPVQGGDAIQLAPKIERLMRERIAATQRSGSVSSPLDSFSIEPEAATNSLIIAASDENLVLVKELLVALTGEESQALARGSMVEVIALTSTRPVDAAQAVNEFYVNPENQRRGPGAVGVIANERLNALVVRGTADDIEAVRELVGRIDTASPLAVQNVRRIELKTANAYEVVQLLDEVLSGRAISGARTRTGQAVKLRFYRQKFLEDLEGSSQYTETEIDAVVREQVALTPELRTNSVLVSAPPNVMEFIESMISDLDTTDAGTRKIEKFRLVNADARAMADVLRNLFSLRQSGSNSLFLVPTVGNEPLQPDEPLAEGLGAQSLTPVPDDRQQLAITIDARTNTLIVSATEEYLELVRDVVEELDSIIATEREQIVFDLQYAQAETVQNTLQQYFQSEAARIRDILSPGQGGSLTRQLEQEVTVVGDPKSQKVLISASPRYIDTVRSIVRELDAAPPQVIIQVLLAEVTLDDADQWGISADAFDVGGDNYDVGFLGAGASLATALGVPNLSVSSTDFSLLVRALQAQGKLEILSNPRLTVNNNESASIQVGENVALPDEVETLTDGRTRASIRREDVGVLLSVTPSISSDGFVRLDIQPEISVVSERTTQISEDFEAPIISTRKVDTTVTVRDGQTVVIGGLIQTTQEDRRTKVPLIGDIPFIGIPFRSHDIKNVRTELLVILTPQVVAGGINGGSHLLDEDAERTIRNYSDPDGLYKLLENHRPAPKETPSIEPIDAREPEADVELETQPSE
ncbi:MAG: secretin N-terminal domain-containing protein [Phycisphaerales bacterium JB061]